MTYAQVCIESHEYNETTDTLDMKLSVVLRNENGDDESQLIDVDVSADFAGSVRVVTNGSWLVAMLAATRALQVWVDEYACMDHANSPAGVDVDGDVFLVNL